MRKILETENINNIKAEIMQNEIESWIELNGVKFRNSSCKFKTPVYVAFKYLIEKLNSGDYRVKNMARTGGCVLTLWPPNSYREFEIEDEKKRNKSELE